MTIDESIVLGIVVLWNLKLCGEGKGRDLSAKVRTYISGIRSDQKGDQKRNLGVPDRNPTPEWS